MSEIVLDASVLLKWFHTDGEPNVKQASKLRADFEAGRLSILVPSLLWLEVMNVAARRLKWSATQLERLAERLVGLGFLVVEPELVRVARWAAEGLTAYDAAYVALAEQSGSQLITDDAGLADQASKFALALAEWPGPDEDGGDEVKNN